MRTLRHTTPLRHISIAIALAALWTGPALAKTAEVFTYRGAGCTGAGRMAPFEALLGRHADGVTEFTELTDWSHMLSSVNWALGCWQGKNYHLSQSVPMLMGNGSGTTLREGATGAYDQHFVALGKLLVAKGYPDAYLRIGWEFNGGWYPWAAAQDPESFKAYFRRIVQAFRSVPGQRFKIVWNPAQGQQQIAPDKVYPGDDVVDIIGLDLYNQSWATNSTDPEVRWKAVASQPYGLDWLKDFATRHGKPMALPEWGTGTRPDGHGFGDDPTFINNVAAFIRANNVAYHTYWDYNAGDFNGEISSGRQPLSAAAFKKDFGTGQ